MGTESKPLQNFNLDTMSGIYPGSRTMIYQRLRLHSSNGSSGWYQLQWYSEPAAAVLRPAQPERSAQELSITLPEPAPSTFVQRLHDELTRHELDAEACFACRFWQPLSIVTDDGLPTGRCRWNDAAASVPSAIATQSALSLACAHMERSEQPQPVSLDAPASQPRVRKTAELDPDRLTFWPRLWHRLFRRDQRDQDWTGEILERSGVGAGTEPCFVCHGRLANLGALAVASAEGDKQTLSIWRCRSCYTTFLNDWTDRWERLENLETEERYFRIAPAEAFAGLDIIHKTKGGDHPGRRADRRRQREQMLALVAGKMPLSHQIRQGR